MVDIDIKIFGVLLLMTFFSLCGMQRAAGFVERNRPSGSTRLRSFQQYSHRAPLRVAPVSTNEPVYTSIVDELNVLDARVRLILSSFGDIQDAERVQRSRRLLVVQNDMREVRNALNGLMVRWRSAQEAVRGELAERINIVSERLAIGTIHLQKLVAETKDEC